MYYFVFKSNRMKKSLYIILLLASTFSQVFSQWEQVNNGIPNVAINCIENSDTTIYAGTDIGIFISTNKGLTWDNTTLYASCYKVKSLAINKSFSYIYSGHFGTGLKRFLYAINTHSVFLYDYYQSILLQNSNVNVIKSNNNIMYSGTNQGLFISSNNGNTWELRNNGIENLEILSMAFLDSNCCIGTNDGIFYSSNIGKTWVKKSFNIVNTNIQSLGIKDSIIYAGTKGGGVYISKNNQDYWIPKNNGLKDLNIQAIQISDKYIFAGTNEGLYVSSNYGDKWTKTSIDKNVLSISKIENNIYIGTKSNGLYISSDNGNTWKNNKFDDKIIRSSTYDSNSKSIYIGTNGGRVYTSKDYASNWEEITNGLETNYIFSILSFKNNIYLCTENGIYISKDYGASWTLNNKGLTENSIYQISNVGDYLFAATPHKVFVSTDFGESWNIKLNDVSLGSSVPIAYVKDKIYYVGPIDKSILFTTDFGETWETVSKTNDFKFTKSMLKFDNYFFVGCVDFKFYQSNDNLKTWNFSYSMPGVTTLLNYNNKIIAGTSNELIISSDLGKSWVMNIFYFPFSSDNKLEIIGDNIYSFTWGFGVYKRKLSDFGILSSVEDNLTTGSEFSIFPNPTQKLLNVQLDKEISNSTKLCIYDLLGNKISESTFQFGTKECIVDLEKLQSGMYFIKINDNVNSFIKW